MESPKIRLLRNLEKYAKDKNVLESLDTVEYRRTCAESKEPRSSYGDDYPEWREKFRAEYKVLSSQLSVLQTRINALLESNDIDFEESALAIMIEIDAIYEKLHTMQWSAADQRIFQSRMADIRTIKNRREFAQNRPLWWLPRKVETARLLALAKQMHRIRVDRGEAQVHEPIKILDVGGANGALGHLLTEIARENDLTIEYSIVDPDIEAMEWSKKIFADNRALQFHSSTINDFLLRLNTDPDVRVLLDEKQKLLDHHTKVLGRLEKFAALVAKEIEWLGYRVTALPDQIPQYCELFQNMFNFQIPLDAILSKDYPRLSSVGSWLCQGKNVRAAYIKQVENPFHEIDRKIQAASANQPLQFDLIISSWMPLSRNFSPDIAALNPAAIAHVIEIGGSTGFQKAAKFPSTIQYVGETSDSYLPQPNYAYAVGWVGQTTARARYAFTQTDQNTPPFPNGFVIHTRDAIGINPADLDINPQSSGIVVGEEYAWIDDDFQRGHGSQADKLISLSSNYNAELVSRGYDRLTDLVRQWEAAPDDPFASHCRKMSGWEKEYNWSQDYGEDYNAVNYETHQQ